MGMDQESFPALGLLAESGGRPGTNPHSVINKSGVLSRLTATFVVRRLILTVSRYACSGAHWFVRGPPEVSHFVCFDGAVGLESR